MNTPRMFGEELRDGVGGLGSIEASKRNATNGLTLLRKCAAGDRIDLVQRCGWVRGERAPRQRNCLRF